MVTARSQCFSACLTQRHTKFSPRQSDTSEGTEYVWPCGRPMMTDLRMTDNLNGTHTKRELKKTKEFFENRRKGRYLFKPIQDSNKLYNFSFSERFPCGA